MGELGYKVSFYIYSPDVLIEICRRTAKNNVKLDSSVYRCVLLGLKGHFVTYIYDSVCSVGFRMKYAHVPIEKSCLHEL